MNFKAADFVIGLQYGDEGKGKVAASLAATFNYKIVARYNGGPNAGHTVQLENKSVALHQLPTGVLFKKQSYIGPGAVISFNKLEQEASKINEVMGFCPFQYLTISPQAIVISDSHISADIQSQAKTQGSTSSGIAPAYASFYNRDALLARDYTWPDKNGRETINYLPKINGNVLLEGAQGYYLNPYQGSYPYTTSSSSHPGSAAATFGFSTSKIRNVIGVAKCYETRSGIDPDFYKIMLRDGNLIEIDQSKDTNVFSQLQKEGKEIGVTTGRNRQVRWLDATRLIKAINETGTNILVVQKWDILSKLNTFVYYHNGAEVTFETVEVMKKALKSLLEINCPSLTRIIYSASPYYYDIDWQDL